MTSSANVASLTSITWAGRAGGAGGAPGTLNEVGFMPAIIARRRRDLESTRPDIHSGVTADRHRIGSTEIRH
jgi:hypothetical protein